MKLTRKRLVVGILGLVALGGLTLVAIFVAILLVFSGESGAPSDQESAIKVTLQWGRLAPLPLSATNLTITTGGNMFNRSFRVAFTAPAADIKQWLKQSPGTREVTPLSPAPGVRHFKIVPGAGAQHAEVTVEQARHRVEIYVYWS